MLPVLTSRLEILGSLGKLPQPHQRFVENSQVGWLMQLGPWAWAWAWARRGRGQTGQKEEARILI